MTTVNMRQGIMERFQRLAKAGRLAHAYLFTGPAGIGKMETSLDLARMVNCDDAANAPCGYCVTCRKIAGGNHPDVHTIGNNEEDSIKIDEIRQMLGRVGLKAYEARTKVFILRNAERMTTEAANALLKTLEEPAPNTLIILTTAVPEACLDTIKSRCHTVKFFSADEHLPEDKDRVMDLFLSKGTNEDLIKAFGTDKEQASKAMLVLLSWVRDVLLYKNGVRQGLVYKNRIADLERMSQRNMTELQALNEQIVHVKSLIDENLNPKMALSLVRERIWGN